jgi:hypothetical protein
MDQCEVSVMIPFDPMDPWSGSIIDSEPDTSVELMAHMALTSLCEDRLTATATLPITLLLIQNQENPIWQQRLEAVSNLKGPHFHIGMTSLARYAEYLFNLQHNTTRTGMCSSSEAQLEHGGLPTSPPCLMITMSHGVNLVLPSMHITYLRVCSTAS